MLKQAKKTQSACRGTRDKELNWSKPSLCTGSGWKGAGRGDWGGESGGTPFPLPSSLPSSPDPRQESLFTG